MNPSGGTVGATPAEMTLAANAQQQFQDYSTRYLPVQQRLNSIVDEMGKPDSWQAQEAEGKGNVDAAASFARADQQRTAATLDKGINVGSGAFKFGITSNAAAEAETKGAAVNEGRIAISNAYLSGLNDITQTGQGIAGAATGGMAVGAQVGSREAISGAQVTNAENTGPYAALGIGLGALTQAGIPKPGGGDQPGSFPSGINAYEGYGQLDTP